MGRLYVELGSKDKIGTGRYRNIFGLTLCLVARIKCGRLWKPTGADFVMGPRRKK